MSVQDTWLRLMLDDMRELRALVDEQAEDDGLWFVAHHASEGYLQHELRRLHAAVELATRWVEQAK